MPLRICRPSCAAGPENTAAWPSRILSLVTPTSAAAPSWGSTIASPVSRRRASFAVMNLLPFLSSRTYCKKILMLHELREVELLPAPPVLVRMFGLQPRLGARRRSAGGRRRLELRRVAQAERAVDEQRAAHAEALADQQQARLVAHADRGLPEERGEVHHAEQVAADVRHALEPRPGQRHRRHLRHGNHFAR